MEFLDRTKLLFGEDYYNKIKDKKVAIFGLGGVGGYAVEGLARSGISNFLVCDNDIVSVSNMNRQIIATVHTVGMKKTDLIKERILAINPLATVEIANEFILRDNAAQFITDDLSFVVDAIDTVTAKLSIIALCEQKNIPIISSMGAGNRTDPSKILITDIFKTENDPLSRVMRKELRKRSIKKLNCICSSEIPIKLQQQNNEDSNVPGSVAFIPSIFGLQISSFVIKELLK